MLLSFEIPIPDLPDFIPFADFPFGLAHLMDNPKYREHHQRCLLDNSMYELGEPLTSDELIRAAALCNPVSIIAPDWMNDHRRTQVAAVELRDHMKDRWPVGAVVQGTDLKERLSSYNWLMSKNFWPICFPFRTPRQETIQAIAAQGGFDPRWWYHLLGLQELSELSVVLPGIWSCDTAKPFKGILLKETRTIRGLGKLDHFKSLNPTAHSIAHKNILYLREIINGIIYV